MAKIFTAADAMELEGSVLTGFSGVLTALYKRTAGTHAENGDWSLQNGRIKSGGKEIKICFSKRDEVPMSWKGKLITLLSSPSNNGMHGVKVEMSDEYTKNGKTYKPEIMIKVTPTAEITQGIASAEQVPTQKAPEAPQTTAGAPAATSSRPPPSKPATQPAAKPQCHDLKTVKRKIMQLYNLSLHVWGAVNDLAIKRNLTPDQAQATASWMHIYLKEDGFIEKMPTSLLKENEKQEGDAHGTAQ